MLASDNNGLWTEFFEISFEFSIVLFASITKTLYHARNTLLTVYKSVVVVFFFQMGYMYLVEWEKKIPNSYSACKR